VFIFIYNKAAKEDWGGFIFSNSTHLEWRVGLSDTILKQSMHILIKDHFKSSPLKLLYQIKPNMTGILLPLFKIMSDSPDLHSRWLLLLKIEISCPLLIENINICV
jgi:hypothetical protein